MKNYIRLVFVSILLLATATSIQPRAQDSAGVDDPMGKIVGRVLSADGKTGVRGARVYVYHLSSERLFESETTAGKAEYEIRDLPYGYFDLAVETPDGLFVGERVVNLAPASRAVVSLKITRTGDLPLPLRGTVRAYPGSESEPIGLARLDQKQLGREFWRSPKGIAIIAGTGGAVLLAIASGSDSETVVSPILP